VYIIKIILYSALFSTAREFLSDHEYFAFSIERSE